MNLTNRVINLIKKNDYLAYNLKVLSIKMAMNSRNKISDKEFIQKQYKRRTGQDLNLENPKTYNEKLQWMKLYYKNPLLNKCVDKYEVREYVKEKLDKCGEEILIPLIGIYNNVNDIDFDKLPNEFIMKLTNGSSFNHICKNKSKSEIKTIKNKFRKWINLDYYAYGREWAYKNVENRIICEKLLKPSSGEAPEDYRFFCFNGKVEFITIDIDSVVNGVKNSYYYRNLYSRNWESIDATIQYPNKVGYNVPKPKRLDDMIRIAEKLSEDFPAVRVDLYYFDEKIYFGELTFYHSSGYQTIKPDNFAKKIGNLIDIQN